MDDQELSESNKNRAKRKRSKRTYGRRLRIAVVFFTGIIMILSTIWIWITFSPQESADPDWNLSHETFTSQADAIATFGTDLLLEQTILPDSYMPAYYTEYALTYHDGNPGMRKNWDEIVCTIYYGDKRREVFQDYIYISILFSDDYQKSFLNNFNKTEVINGIEVGFINSSSEHFGQFIYHGIAYNVYGDNAELVELTVEQMLSGL